MLLFATKYVSGITVVDGQLFLSVARPPAPTTASQFVNLFSAPHHHMACLDADGFQR